MADVRIGSHIATNENVAAATTTTESIQRCSSLEELVRNAERGDRGWSGESRTRMYNARSVPRPLCSHSPTKDPALAHTRRAEPRISQLNTKSTGTTETHGSKTYPQATVQDVLSCDDSQVRKSVQRAAARGVQTAIEGADGFKYCFNNVWGLKDGDGQRFSYICQDSVQNKDRHANRFTRTQNHLKGGGERGVRKPTFDCRGSIGVRFSANRGCVDVFL